MTSFYKVLEWLFASPGVDHGGLNVMWTSEGIHVGHPSPSASNPSATVYPTILVSTMALRPSAAVEMSIFSCRKISSQGDVQH